MPNIFKKVCIWILSAAMLLPLLMQNSFADNDSKKLSLPYFDLPVTVQTITVGLRSGGSALSEAKLQNKVGSGYSVGYYDLTRSFKSYGYIGSTAISVCADIGAYVSGDIYIGPYHIMLSYIYSDFKAAEESADSLGGFPAYINGQYRVLVGAFADYDSAQEMINDRKFNAEIYTGSAAAVIVSETNTANIKFFCDNYGRKLAVKPAADEQTPETWFDGYYYCGGFEFSRNGSEILATNYVDLESYVGGVLPYEMNGDWPIEALKSQAVCARTYAINNLNSYAANGYDVRSDTYSQVYRGVTESTDTTEKAAADTVNEYVRHKGTICKVYYMSSDGGATESGENTFKQRRKYLSAVEDPFEKDIDYYNKNWEAAFSTYELQYKLNNRGFDVSPISDVFATESDAGNVITLRFVDTNGTEASVYNIDCYKLLGLNSINYTVEKAIKKVPIEKKEKTNVKTSQSKDTKEKTQYKDVLYFVFKGHGWGHNCGLSQWGSYSMAKYYGKNYDEIIDYYFSGAYIK